jgi:hypothetical protein
MLMIRSAMRASAAIAALSIVVLLAGCAAADIEVRRGAIVHRRNQIVHEGDLRWLIRPQTIGLNGIAASTVSADIDWLDTLIAAVDAIL